jgi:REP element-mobilizing transposase RayT
LSGAKIFACSILPEHVHLVVARHRFKIERAANLLKGEATKALAGAGLHPFQDDFYRDGTRPSPWTRKWWKVYLTTDADILRAIKYVEQNPVKEGKRRQKWLCMTEFTTGP